jgi:proteasome lid subunit RPN8/RPN11
LQLPRRLLDEMIAQAQSDLPNECCGFLAGTVEARTSAEADTPIPQGRVLQRYPLLNAAASPTAYFADPAGLFAAHKDMRRRGIELLAIYHSHPTSEPVPSRRDREQNQYPGVVHLIISLQTGQPMIRAWWLTTEAHQEAEWELGDFQHGLRDEQPA